MTLSKQTILVIFSPEYGDLVTFDVWLCNIICPSLTARIINLPGVIWGILLILEIKQEQDFYNSGFICQTNLGHDEWFPHFRRIRCSRKLWSDDPITRDLMVGKLQDQLRQYGTHHEKTDLKALSLSYQKKDGHVWLRPKEGWARVKKDGRA